jgi:hypothetical protein
VKGEGQKLGEGRIGGRGNRRGRYGRSWKGEEEEESGGRDFANHRPQL